MAKADINFKKELWDAGNELRGAVSKNNYKNYIYPLEFLKYLSERYQGVHDEQDKLFLTTGIPACLFILSKNRDGRDGIHRERKNEIVFIDASEMSPMASRKLHVFSGDDIQKIDDTYHMWRTVNSNSSVIGSVVKQSVGAYHDTSGYSYSATLAKVKNQDYKLTPGIYVGTEAELDDGIPFEEKMEGLKVKLNQQFEKSNELQVRIKKNLQKI